MKQTDGQICTRCVLRVCAVLLGTELAHDKARPVLGETDKMGQPHLRERKGVWCAPRISNPMAGAFGVCGEFDSHPSRFSESGNRGVSDFISV